MAIDVDFGNDMDKLNRNQTLKCSNMHRTYVYIYIYLHNTSIKLCVLVFPSFFLWMIVEFACQVSAVVARSCASHHAALLALLKHMDDWGVELDTVAEQSMTHVNPYVIYEYLIAICIFSFKTSAFVARLRRMTLPMIL